LGFTHFIFEPVFDKPAQKSKASKNRNTDSEPVADEQKPVTRVMVYFYNSPRTRNGVKSIPLSDIDPDYMEPAPVVEEEKPEPKKKKGAAVQDVTPVTEQAPVVQAAEPTLNKKKNEARPEQVTPVIETAPAVAVEKTARKQKQEIAPQEVIPLAKSTTGAEVEKVVIPKSQPRARRYLLPGDIEQTPEGIGRVQDLGDLFN
jgi:hypothetical protein